MRAAIALTALLIATTAFTQPYDDPAVLACEELAKSALHERANYSRLSAEIAGGTVRLRYRVQIMTAVPEDKTLACPFALNQQSGYWNYAPAADAEHQRGTLVLIKTGIYPIAKEKTALK
jgi:hypothetical protein